MQRVGKEDVTVMADVKNEQGQVVGQESLETQRVAWNITVHQQTQCAQEANEPSSLEAMVQEANSLMDKAAALSLIYLSLIR